MDNFSISVKGWWKMAISHLKHGYLNWRAIPCKENDLYLCSFSSFSQYFFLTLLIFIWTQLKFFKCMTWQSIFLFAFFFFSFSWSVYFGHIINGLPTWSTSSYVRIVLRGLVFLVQICLGHFCPREDHGSKVFQRNGCFLVNMFQDINLGDFKVSRSLDFVLLIENVWQVWNCSESWCIPNYQLLVPFKNSSFLLLDFRRIRE